MKRITSLFLALVMLCLAPLTTIAQAQQLDEYGGVLVHVPLDKDLLEKHFREYVKNAANYYFAQANQGTSFIYSKYYYEAADLKAAFDSEWFFGNTQENLAYNTQENISKRNYEQETREITLYMLCQDVQNKADQLMMLTPEQKASFFPGIMFDPITGEPKLNKQATIAQEQYNTEVEQKIKENVADVSILFVDTVADYSLAVFGNVKSEQTYKWTGAATDWMADVWKYAVQLRYEEEQKQLENAYRAAMIEDIASALQNVDDQMFSGLYALYNELKQKNALDTEESILLESLGLLLSTIEKSRHLESVLSKQLNGGATLQQEIDRIAKELVDDAGMTKEELRTQSEILFDFFTYSLIEATLTIVDTLIEVPESQPKLRKEIIEAVKTAVIETVGDLKDYFLDLTATDTPVNMADILGKIGQDVFEDAAKSLISKLTISSWEEKVEQARQDWKDAKKEVKKSKKLGETWEEQQKKENNAESARKNWRKERDELRKFNVEAFTALVEDGIKLVECTVDMAIDTASLGDVGDDEVVISYMASAMYRAKELAEEGRDHVMLSYASMANPKNIDLADLDELKAFLDSMYVVLNTDMLGESYYATLCSWQEYQHDPNEWERVMAEKQALLDAKYEAAWERGRLFGAVYTLFTPLYGGAGNVAAWICMGDSEYLKKVQKESKLGSWMSSDEAVTHYNSLANTVTSHYKFPELFEPLFE